MTTSRPRYDTPSQDPCVPLSRLPTRSLSGFEMTDVQRVPAGATVTV